MLCRHVTGNWLAHGWLAAHLILRLMIDDAAADSFALPSETAERPKAHFSLWRLHRFLRDLLVNAILGAPWISHIGSGLTRARRNLFEPPRRRMSQLTQIRFHPA
jgi:hypothetical protein